MKYVIIPKSVNIVDRTGNPVNIKRGDLSVPWLFSHEDFVLDSLCASPEMSVGGGDGMRRQRKIEQAFTGCKEGDVIGVEDADFKIALAICGVLKWSEVVAKYATQFLPHAEAWEAAVKQDDAWKKKYDAEKAEKSNGAAVPPSADKPAEAAPAV